MKNNLICSVLALAIAAQWLLMSGCAGSDVKTAPSMHNPEATSATYENNRYLWGYWLIGIDPASNEYEIIPSRNVQDHWNALKWLEKGPCTDCLKITGFTNSDHGTKLVTISLEHPFSNPNVTGFDVRGIAMFNGSYTFATSGLTTSDRSQGDPELINADGFTHLYNSSTAGSGPNGLQGYQKGKFATASMPNSSMNGFRRYDSPGAANTRNAFYAGATIQKVFDIAMPGTPFLLGYAVDASWETPTTKPVTDPMIDFPPEANCYEPYEIELEARYGNLTDEAGSIHFEMTVHDHQGTDSHEAPLAECLDVFDDIYIDELNPGHYSFYMYNDKSASPGIYKLLMSVEDNENAGSPAWIDLSAYQIHTFEIYDDLGWARTWGSSNRDQGDAIAVDGYGNVYVAGMYQGTVDFDPGTGVVEQTSNGGSIDAFVSKFNIAGNFEWVKTWGGPGIETVEDIDIVNGVSIVGSFEDTVDFDPGGNENNRTSNGGSDAYYQHFSLNGGYYDVVAWGGPEDDEANSVVYVWTSGRTIVTGSFRMAVIFPNGGIKNSAGESDIYIVDVNEGSDLLGAWGGVGEDYSFDTVFDGYQSIFMTGSFSDQVNFGGMGGVRDSAGSCDAYLAEYVVENDGVPEFNSVSTWGDTGMDAGDSICHYNNELYITGYFMGTVDFHPAGSVDNRTASGMADAYVCHYTESGGYSGVVTWGGSDALMIDSGYDVTTDNDGNVYAVGSYFGGPPNGFDGIIVKYDPDLNPQWTNYVGGTESDGCHSVYTDNWERVFIAGAFKDVVDFDPTAGVDQHTWNGGMADCFILKLYSDGQW